MAHRKAVRHFHEAGHLHELTFSWYRRMPLITNDIWRERLARCIDAAGEEASMELVGFVFMPEHVNPVNRGRCGHAVDWKWSSARHDDDSSVRQPPDLPRIQGLPEGAVY